MALHHGILLIAHIHNDETKVTTGHICEIAIHCYLVRLTDVLCMSFDPWFFNVTDIYNKEAIKSISHIRKVTTHEHTIGLSTSVHISKLYRIRWVGDIENA